METQETPTSTPRKSLLPYLIATGILVLLAAAAFMAVRYFAQPKNTARGPEAANIISVEGPGGQASTFALDIKPARELPARQPDEIGMFVERQDNSIFIGTGQIDLRVEAAPGEEPQVDSNYSGPKLEVVVSSETVIYKDTTELDPENPGAEVQQTVELSTIDEITEQSSIMVWGRKAGDRIIADVIMFSGPIIARAPGAP